MEEYYSKKEYNELKKRLARSEAKVAELTKKLKELRSRS
jgi:hypothetical protein